MSGPSNDAEGVLAPPSRYRKDVPVDTVEARRAALQGFGIETQPDWSAPGRHVNALLRRHR